MAPPAMDRSLFGERYHISTTADTGAAGAAACRPTDVLEDFTIPEAKSVGFRWLRPTDPGSAGESCDRSPNRTTHVGKESKLG